METVELLPPALCVCGLLANGEPESNLIKTFPVNIKHITDIHATQDLQWPASAPAHHTGSGVSMLGWHGT